MADHVKRMVNGWYDRAAELAGETHETELLTPLVDGIYRLIREAERRAHDHCIDALPTDIDHGARNQVVDAIRLLEAQGRLGRRSKRMRSTD